MEIKPQIRASKLAPPGPLSAGSQPLERPVIEFSLHLYSFKTRATLGRIHYRYRGSAAAAAAVRTGWLEQKPGLREVAKSADKERRYNCNKASWLQKPKVERAMQVGRVRSDLESESGSESDLDLDSDLEERGLSGSQQPDKDD